MHSVFLPLDILWGLKETKTLHPLNLSPATIWKAPEARAQKKTSLWRSYSVWLLVRGQEKTGCPGKKQDDRESKGERGFPMGGLWKWQYFSQWLCVFHPWSYAALPAPPEASCINLPFEWEKCGHIWGSWIEKTPGMWVTDLGTGCWADEVWRSGSP